MHFSRSAMRSAGFHGWNPLDFMKFAWFHEICQISCEICWISWWNLPDFMKFTWFHEIRWISWIKSAGFHEIHLISWNLLDFMKSAEFHDGFHEICQMSQEPMVLFFTKKTKHQSICHGKYIIILVNGTNSLRYQRDPWIVMLTT